MDANLVVKLLVWAPPVLLAVTLHEVAHGWVARWLGDPTAASLGRLSLNPLRHVDPVGTVLVPALMLALSGMVFGWAKPVPVDWRRLRHPRRDMALVAAAGPLANLGMLAVWLVVALIGRNLAPAVPGPGALLIYMGVAGIIINAVLAGFNLVPIPPLDGSRVLMALLPPPLALAMARLEPFGLVIVLAVLLAGGFRLVLAPVMALVARVVGPVLGL